MRARRTTLWACVLGFVFFSRVHSAACQTAPAQPIGMERESATTPTSANREGLIHLDVTVTDEAGTAVSGLMPKDFTLLHDGDATKIVSFRTSEQARDDTERLTEVVLVLDEVNLSPVQFELVKQETVKFLEQNGGHLPTPVSIYWFSPTGFYATARPTTDGDALAHEVLHQRSARLLWPIPPSHDPHMTAQKLRYLLWEKDLRALYSIAIERRDKPGRKIVVWLGFGWPVYSGFLSHPETAFSSIVELSTRIREARLALYQITDWSDPAAFNFDYLDFAAGVRTPEELKKLYKRQAYDQMALQVLAIQNGGLILDKAPDIVRALKRSIDEASTFYTLSFDPPRATQPDEYHDLKVQIARPALSARTNTGYYDQPVFYDQPPVPSRRVSVRELGEILSQTGGASDDKLSAQLNNLELTERLRSALLLQWKDRLRGRGSKATLLRLADASAFLTPPSDEILSDAVPDSDEQRSMLSRTAKFVDDVLPRLPDFFAARSTIRFEQRSPKEADTWKTALSDQSLHEAATERATLRYRNGHEERDAEKKTGNRNARRKNLDFIGVFGPILSSVLADATRAGSTLAWSHWEQGDYGQEAVFDYSVRATSPSYNVVDCCLRGGTIFRSKPQYHGQLSIDPKTGAILRLTMESEPGWIVEPDLQPVRPVKATGMMIEYGPVEIGGRKYICPYRSVEIMRSQPVRTLVFWDQRFEVYAAYETLLDDISYGDYHKFGSESRILPGFEVAPDSQDTHPNH